MPSRYIREAYLDSETVSLAGDAAEVMFFRLALVVDDYGRFDGRVSMVQRKCWPIGKPTDPSVEEVEARLVKLDAVGLIQRYESDGKPYIYIPKFKQRTRSPRSKFPEPPAHRTPLARQPADIAPSLSGHHADTPPTDSGQPAAACPPRTSTRSRSNPGSVSNPNPREARPADEVKPQGETPAELYQRVTGKPLRKPFEDEPEEPHAHPQPPASEPGEGAST